MYRKSGQLTEGRERLHRVMQSNNILHDIDMHVCNLMHLVHLWKKIVALPCDSFFKWTNFVLSSSHSRKRKNKLVETVKF